MRLLIMMLPAIWNLAAADLPTRWAGTMRPADGSVADVSLKLQQQGDTISGTLAYQDETRQIAIEKPELDRNQLTFQIHDNKNRVVSFRLTLGDDTLSGEARSADRVAEVRMYPVRLQGVFRVG